MEGIEVSAGQTVLILWSGQSPSEDLQDTVTDLQKRVQDSGRIQVEHIDRLALGIKTLIWLNSGIYSKGCLNPLLHNNTFWRL